MITEERDECPSGCRWGWRNTEQVPLHDGRALEEGDVWAYVEFIRIIGEKTKVKRCQHDGCNYRMFGRSA